MTYHGTVNINVLTKYSKLWFHPNLLLGDIMDKEFSKLFGARVRYFRNLARLSQEQV